MKKIGKLAGAFCMATGVVAISSVVASGAALRAVKGGFLVAADTVKKILEDAEVEKKDEGVIYEETKCAEALETVECEAEEIAEYECEEAEVECGETFECETEEEK